MAAFIAGCFVGFFLGWICCALMVRSGASADAIDDPWGGDLQCGYPQDPAERVCCTKPAAHTGPHSWEGNHHAHH